MMSKDLEEMKACVLDVLEKCKAEQYMRQTSIAKLCNDTSHNQFLTFQALRELRDKEEKVEEVPGPDNESRWRISG